MTVYKCALVVVLWLAALPMLPLNLGATTIDLSAAATAELLTGDSLSFQVFTWNFAANAEKLGLSRYPTDISFMFVSAPLEGPAGFEAELQSQDESLAASFGAPLGITQGAFSASGYQGAVATIQGHLHLSTLQSVELFGGSSMRIRLRNTGPDVTLGLARYTLPQDLFVSLSAGPLSVGGLHGPVTLEKAAGETTGLEAVTLPSADAPEAGSAELLLGGGVLLCVVSGVLKRIWLRLEKRVRLKQE